MRRRPSRPRVGSRSDTFRAPRPVWRSCIRGRDLLSDHSRVHGGSHLQLSDDRAVFLDGHAGHRRAQRVRRLRGCRGLRLRRSVWSPVAGDIHARRSGWAVRHDAGGRQHVAELPVHPAVRLRFRLGAQPAVRRSDVREPRRRQARQRADGVISLSNNAVSHARPGWRGVGPTGVGPSLLSWCVKERTCQSRRMNQRPLTFVNLTSLPLSVATALSPSTFTSSGRPDGTGRTSDGLSPFLAWLLRKTIASDTNAGRSTPSKRSAASRTNGGLSPCLAKNPSRSFCTRSASFSLLIDAIGRNASAMATPWPNDARSVG